MATTLTRILVHFIFSTKRRERLIVPSVEGRLHAYMRGVAKHCACPVLAMNGTEDHVHMLVSMGKMMAVAELMETVKKESSRWVRKEGVAGFSWQEGYAGFSIGESGVGQVTKYIARQKLHHRRTTFREELEMFLAKYGVAYEAKYLWA